MPDHAVQQFDGVGRVAQLADVRWVGEKRGQIRPICLPAPAYLRVTIVAPGTGERLQSLIGWLSDRG